MKPKTAIQKKVVRLSATLPPISYTQEQWAYANCIEHIAYRTKSGTLTCSDCGHQWKSDNGSLCDSLAGCRCPHCGAELKPYETRRRTDRQTQYFSVITTCGGFQLIRVAQVESVSKKGEPRKNYCKEVVQRWISPEGKVTTMALLRGFSFMYCDCWTEWSAMEIRRPHPLYDNVCEWGKTYPRKRYISQLYRNGFNGNFHGLTPITLFKALLSDPRMETLMKAGKIREMKYFISNPLNADELWASYLIAKRHHYQINNISMWCDYLRMLQNLGQDIRNPKNICPEDFINAHDIVSRRIDAKRRKERAEAERIREIEKREREQQRLLQEQQREDDFKALKSKFFGLVISDSEISVKVLESIEEYYEEGMTQNICVFGAEYYKKANTLILSARIDGQIVETVEVDLRTLKVVQCHGRNNQNTEYHDRIIDLVNSNAQLIKERMTA